MAKNNNKSAVLENNEVSNDAVVAEQPKTAETKPAEPVIKQTPVEERKYELAPPATNDKGETVEVKFRGKQRQAVYDAMKELARPALISEVAALAESKGLTAVGGVEPSVRYHLHHMTKDGFTVVTNPTITIE